MQSIENAINIKIIIQILYYPQFPSRQLPVTCLFTSRYSFIFPLHLFYLMTCQWSNSLISNSETDHCKKYNLYSVGKIPV